MTFKIDKVVGTLPGTLTPNTVYAVRVGVGFDLYISDTTGAVAHKINKQLMTKGELDTALGDDLRLYVQSRGENLVTNGTGLLRTNYNFSPFDFDSAQAYSATGSFLRNSRQAILAIDEYLPLDTSAAYELSAYLKWSGDQQPRHYLAMAFYDADGLEILTRHHVINATGTARTTLAQPLKPGDTVVYLTSAAGFENASANWWLRQLGIYGHKNAGGYVYPGHSYTRNVVGDLVGAWNTGAVNLANNTITLRSALAPQHGNPDAVDGAWPVGHPVANNINSAGYKYFTNGTNAPTPSNWTKYSGVIAGLDLSGTNKYTMFPPGTASGKVMFLLNRDTTNAQKTWVSNVELKQVTRYAKLTINNEDQNPVTTLAVDGDLGPYTDNIGNCGVASRRWAQVYSVTGAINTSDARLKTAVRPFTANELTAAKELSAEIGIFQWLYAIEKKGAGARQHVGVTVQRVIEILTANGLDPCAYGMVCYDSWPEKTTTIPAELDEDGNELMAARTEITEQAGDLYSLRHDQLLAFVLRGLSERLARLEAGGLV